MAVDFGRGRDQAERDSAAVADLATSKVSAGGRLVIAEATGTRVSHSGQHQLIAGRDPVAITHGDQCTTTCSSTHRCAAVIRRGGAISQHSQMTENPRKPRCCARWASWTMHAPSARRCSARRFDNCNWRATWVTRSGVLVRRARRAVRCTSLAPPVQGWDVSSAYRAAGRAKRTTTSSASWPGGDIMESHRVDRRRSYALSVPQPAAALRHGDQPQHVQYATVLDLRRPVASAGHPLPAQRQRRAGRSHQPDARRGHQVREPCVSHPLHRWSRSASASGGSWRRSRRRRPRPRDRRRHRRLPRGGAEQQTSPDARCRPRAVSARPSD